MNILELMVLVKDLPSDIHVVVKGYEGGYYDVKNIKEMHI